MALKVGLAAALAHALVLVACGGEVAAAKSGGDASVASDAGLADAPGADASDASGTGTLGGPHASALAPGPLHCGFRTVSIGYDLPLGLGKRTIPLGIWYPTAVADGPHPTYVKLFKDATAVVDAELAPALHQTGYPTLVHSHGYLGFAGNSATLFCFLASHGWVTLAPEHVGNTFLDTPPSLPMAHWVARPLDIRQTVQWAVKPPAGDALAGKLDTGHLAVSGHSFGTYTVWASAGASFDAVALAKKCTPSDWADCQPPLLSAFGPDLAEPKFKTAIALAGDGSGVFGPQGKNAVKIPVLQMNGSLDNAGQAELYDAVTAVDLTWVKVEGGCHQLYGLGNPVNGGDACKALDPAVGYQVVEAWLLSWLRVHALGEATGEAADIVSGKLAVSPLCTRKHEGGNTP